MGVATGVQMTSMAAAGGTLPVSPARVTAAYRAVLAPRRRKLTTALGLLWLLDAALQFQPYMFTKAFPDQLITPVGAGNPGWVRAPAQWAGTLMASHINIWNALFATTQLVIALGLFCRRTTKLALAASIGWALAVWWLGEGLGGVLAGPVSPVMGLPGAVLLYAILAALVWPRDSNSDTSAPSVASAGLLRDSGSQLLWLLLWDTFILEALRPANRSPSALRDMVQAAEPGEPSWIKAIDRAGVSVLARHGTQVSAVMVLLFALIAVSVFVPSLTRPGLALAAAAAVLIWVFGQDFGALATGHATDPNSGPLLAMLAACYWPMTREKPSRRRQAAQACGRTVNGLHSTFGSIGDRRLAG